MRAPQLGAFAERFRVLRYDSRGHGHSAVTPGPYRIAQLGHDAIAPLDALAIDRAHFCGLSKGGMVGIWLAIHAASRFDRLIVANTEADAVDRLRAEQPFGGTRNARSRGLGRTAIPYSNSCSSLKP